MILAERNALQCEMMWEEKLETYFLKIIHASNHKSQQTSSSMSRVYFYLFFFLSYYLKKHDDFNFQWAGTSTAVVKTWININTNIFYAALILEIKKA